MKPFLNYITIRRPKRITDAWTSALSRRLFHGVCCRAGVVADVIAGVVAGSRADGGAAARAAAAARARQVGAAVAQLA